MNRLEFEELELQVQQSGLPLKLYLQQTGASYSPHQHWHKCSVARNNAKQEFAPISFKRAVTESSLEEPVPHGMRRCFSMAFVPTSGTGLGKY